MLHFMYMNADFANACHACYHNTICTCTSRFTNAFLIAPTKPTGVMVVQNATDPEHYLVVTWTSEHNVSFNVEIMNDKNETTDSSGPISDFSYVTMKLIPGALYSAVVVANNTDGESEPTDKVFKRTSG